MGTIHVSAEGDVGDSAEVVYGYLADMHQHHPNFLPEAFSGLHVDSGGVGAGTVFRVSVSAGGRQRDYLMHVTEPEPGSVLEEHDQNSSLVTRFTVTPAGEASRVQIETTWEGAGGIGGFFERTFAPRVMRGIYEDELGRLDAYARERRAG
jgi:hypothetical protein